MVDGWTGGRVVVVVVVQEEGSRAVGDLFFVFYSCRVPTGEGGLACANSFLRKSQSEKEDRRRSEKE